MGEIKAGDKVFGSHGQPVTVIGVYPQGDREAWRVKCKYAGDLYVDADHLWRVTSQLWRKRKNREGIDYSEWRAISPISTAELARDMTHGKRCDLNWSIPIAGPLKLPDSTLPISPYVLGVWLGDGESKCARITCSDEDIFHYRLQFFLLGEEIHAPIPSRSRRSTNAYAISKSLGTKRRRKEGLHGRLRFLNLIGNKHIPQSYLRASVYDRLSLLAGLMDTDGTITKDGRAAIFTNTNRRLAYAVHELLTSLGRRPSIREGRAMLNNKDCGPVWSIEFRPFTGCVSLPRKEFRVRQKRSQLNRDVQRMISEVENTGVMMPMTCINVDADDHLFLAGLDMIPTHNSHTFAQIGVLRMAGALEGYPDGPARIASARQFQNSIDESVKVAVEHYIVQMGLSDEFECLKYEINHENGSHMWFPGFNRNPESMLSTEGMDVLWIEQAESIGDEMELIVPTVRKPGSELWFSWNPQQRAQWCWKRFVVNPRPGDISSLVTYKDNPFWDPFCISCLTYYGFDKSRGQCECGGEITTGLLELEEERLALEREDPDRYPHIYLGTPDDGDASKQVLTYQVLMQCVEAYDKKLYPDKNDVPVTDAGLDIAEGGSNKCALVIRRGPIIEFLDMWPGVAGDLSVAAKRAHADCTSYGDVFRLYYDASSPMMREFNEFSSDYDVRSVAFGAEVGGPDKLYETRRQNKKVFARRNIQMADALRLRANRTVKLLNGDKSIDTAECLFIRPDVINRPDISSFKWSLDQYLAEMTQPVRRQNPKTGKWELDKRGVGDDGESPDSFDATCLAFCRDSDNGLRAW